LRNQTIKKKKTGKRAFGDNFQTVLFRQLTL